MTLLLALTLFSLHSNAAKPGKHHSPSQKPLPAIPGCPHDRKDWMAKGPKILVEKALLQHAPVEIPDFTAKLGKKNAGASGRATPYAGNGKTQMALVEAQDDATGIFLSGVLKCDPAHKGPILMSLTYVQGNKSGLVPVVAE